MDLGRFQRGDKVPLSVATLDGSTAPVVPDAAPLATIADPSSDVVATLRLPRVDRDSTRFAIGYFLGILFEQLGTYTVTYGWSFHEGAGSLTTSDTFELIAGGDEGGAVISMFHLERPEAGYVVGQLASGKLVQGRNPRLT